MEDLEFTEGEIVIEGFWDGDLLAYCTPHHLYYLHTQECPACLSEEDVAYGAYEELEDYFGPRE